MDKKTASSMVEGQLEDVIDMIQEFLKSEEEELKGI